jgi:hypothetical protein
VQFTIGCVSEFQNRLLDNIDSWLDGDELIVQQLNLGLFSASSSASYRTKHPDKCSAADLHPKPWGIQYVFIIQNFAEVLDPASDNSMCNACGLILSVR